MKLKELNQAIATACNVKPIVVSAIQNEMFKQILATLDKGEKVVIAGFGIFATRDIPGADGAPSTKQIRFRPRTGEGNEGKDNAAARKEKAAKAAAQNDDDGED